MLFRSLIGLVLIALFVSGCGSSSSGSFEDNEIIYWNSKLLELIRSEKVNPPKASRQMAMMHAAIFDAMVALNPVYRPYRYDPSSSSAFAFAPASRLFATTSSDDTLSVAAASAAKTILTALYPSRSEEFSTYYTNRNLDRNTISTFTTAEKYGKASAQNMISFRSSDDGSTGPASPTVAAGVWRPTPPSETAALLPGWGQLTPFTMSSASQFRGNGMPALTSSTYATEYDQVKTLGAKTGSTRTDDQTDIAKFWADGSGTVTPPGHWNVIAKQIAQSQNTSLLDTARLFALLNLAMADAAIAAWEMKYTYWFWRPITAIREGASDGNSSTTADTTWEPLLTTPPFPDYVSGHSTFSAAGAKILSSFFGSDNFSFTTDSEDLPGKSRSFSTFTAAADEAGISRIYGGIHFATANEHGKTAGRSIAEQIVQNRLKAR